MPESAPVPAAALATGAPASAASAAAGAPASAASAAAGAPASAASAAAGPPALAIERLTVLPDRIACDVQVAPGAPRLTSPRLAAAVCAAFPDLPRHACVNDAGDTFGAVMERTSLPHLLEHLVIDLQTRASSTSGDAVFVGTTRWTDESAGRAHIEVSFTDDLVALRAFRDAAAYLNEAVVTYTA